ncbi:MAG: DNA repair protein RecN [Clostridiales Family XIII bacterium]|jgi:DNA repair protein RecN (Recombination protein N)|nr:DNA repair protein RecN [Clostridiales Family XIII bacterium]
MISHIRIQDFAIIQEIDAEFHDGLSVITGETGAGKSIIIEAVSLALGGRADRQFVRTGKEKARIQVVADQPETVISREISAAGKSLCLIDGQIVPLKDLETATRRLADIHGQYDQQNLLYPERHIEIIDAFGAKHIEPAKTRVAEKYAAYETVKKQLAQLKADANASEREKDFLRFEIREIDAAKADAGEYEELTEQVKIQQHSEQIFRALSEATGALSDGERPAVEALAEARGSLSAVAGISRELAALHEELGNLYYALEEQASAIRRMLEGVDFSPRSLDENIARLDLLDRLTAKYGAKGDIDAMLKHRDAAAEKLSRIEFSAEEMEKLAGDLARRTEELAAESAILSKLRRKAGEALVSAITAELTQLNFSDAKLDILFTGEPDDPACFTESGTDKAEFLISANKGQPMLPIARSASGGELSRIMLAFKAVIAEFDRTPTLIFDEIDTGISGVTASVVGEKLLQMAAHRQIICITHLPQIAALAAHHYRIEKSSDEAATYTTLREIQGEERVQDIARLLGGKNITQATLQTARELLEQ